MKYIIALLMPMLCFADSAQDWRDGYQKELDKAALFISKMPEYSCFTMVYEVKPQLPWEIGGLRNEKAHMLIRKSETGFLFAQPVPDCEKRESCGYWIRSTTFKDNVWTHNLHRVSCPKKLNEKMVLELIRTEYSKQYRLK